ncbi:MAG: TRAP transporter small permease [Rhodospirillales bacterium]|nr:TRAP transporter small permease [Rhodospirillales bacterium]MDH3920829.1 TRAP transporter small permease [Rhodospirillales bacterium]MDH3970185.1 TRAP transporter small permease [Rhodospirillales bacterium]
MMDRLSGLLARVSAWAFFVVGLMICYEVALRYFFNAPTVWAEEMSRFVQLWATYLAAAWALRHRELIRIGIVTDRLPAAARRWLELFSLLVIAVFSGVAVWYGSWIAWDSVVQHRTTSTMLDVPAVLTEAAIPVGFTLLGLQALLEMPRVWREGAPAPTAPEALH